MSRVLVVSWAVVGPPHPVFIGTIALELVVALLVLWWHSRVFQQPRRGANWLAELLFLPRGNVSGCCLTSYMEALLIDPASPETRVEFGMVEAEVYQRGQWRLSAAAFGAIDDVLCEAANHPEVFIDALELRGDDVEFAERAAVADLAVRLSLAESTVRRYGATARTLRERLPLVWAWFADGEVATANAREAADIAGELGSQHWAAFEAAIVDAAKTLAPARFRARARRVRDTLLAETSAERHGAAVAERRVWIEHDRDGMGWLNARLPSEVLSQIGASVDAAAFELFTAGDETRTMAQLRADVLGDLILGSPDVRPQISVALTIPVLSLLGHSGGSAVLEGARPIDVETARQLCATAPSLTRLLTDPITGTVLAMDAKQYRPSAALKRWLAITQVTCDFPGCGRAARQCDLDHTTAWAHGGQTSADNLSHRCRKHHSMKHQTKWRVERPPGSATAVWTSPTGYRREADPPPF